MSCYHPLLGKRYELKDNGKWIYKIEGLYDPLAKELFPGSISIPCGRCIGCRLDYSRQWADRMMLELDHSKKAIFVTLTYDNDHVPISMYDENDVPESFTLEKRDFQLFMKKFRSRKEFENIEIRFYASGEYGSKTFRPHYHAIIFGLSLDDFPDKVQIGMNELHQAYFRSDFLADIWSNGFCLLTDVSWQTCAYVARYVMKKVNSPINLLYAYRNANPEFSLMSRRPGIGSYYIDEHPDVFDKTKLYLSGSEHPVFLPKYFLKKLELIDKDKYDKIVADRRSFAEDRILLKMQQTDLSFVEQLELEENNKLVCTGVLKRSDLGEEAF